MLTKRLNDSLDLLGEFSGWGEDKSLGLLHAWIDVLQDADGESTRFTGTRLGLSESVSSFDDRKNTLLLDLRGLLVTVTEDTSKKVGCKVEVLEGIHLFGPVRLDVFTGDDFGGLLLSSFAAFFLFDLFLLILHLWLGLLLSLSGYILTRNGVRKVGKRGILLSF
jgi:hypothetical protein